MSAGSRFKPRILGFLCNWCCYAGADLCGVSRFQYPPNIRVIRLMCSGRVDMSFILRAFSVGQDAVFIGGCWPGECHYITEGNYDAYSMMMLTKKILKHVGVHPDRLRLEWVSASEGIRFSEVMTDFSAQVKKLGPLGRAEGEESDPQTLKARLEAAIKLIPYIKMVKRDKLALHLEQEAEYDGLYNGDEIRELLDNPASYYIDPSKCQACMICSRKCPVDAIEGGKNLIHVIDQDKCIKCGTCLEACPERFGAVLKISGEPAPHPLPAAERMIDRGVGAKQA